MIRKRILAALFLATIAASTVGASATPGDKEAARCDSWFRDGNAPDGTRYDDDYNSPSNPGYQVTMDDGPATPVGPSLPGPVGQTEFVSEGGHYVVRNGVLYVEVVGGQSYARPLGNPAGAQGGYVQGEVDAGSGVPDADFHASTFLGTSPGAYQGYFEKNACVNVADTRVGAMDCTKPPRSGSTACN